MATVLVIKDEAPIRANLERFLKAKGYAVFTASDGAGGIGAARAQRPDIIICDILMLRADGFDMLSELKADTGTARIPLIFLTASTDKEDRQRGLASGATDYVTKPFKLAELLGVIRKRLGDAATK